MTWTMTWKACRLLWEAKGWKIEAVAEELLGQERFKNRKLSASSIQRLSQTLTPIDAELVGFIRSLPTQADREHLVEIVEAGLNTLSGLETPAMELDALLDQWAARLPNAEALAAAIANKLPEVDVEQLAAEVAARLPKPDVDGLAAGIAAKLPTRTLAADIARELLPWVVGAVGLIAAIVCGLALILANARPHPHWPKSVVVVNGMVGSGQFSQPPERGQLHADMASNPQADMGERKFGPPMPREPLPEQAMAPCRRPAVAVFNSCWIKVADQPAPCPEDAFEYDKACYVPVMLHPKSPVGNEAR